MRKYSIIFLTVTLLLVICMSLCSCAFAQELAGDMANDKDNTDIATTENAQEKVDTAQENTANENTADNPENNKTLELVNIIVTYAFFVLALFAGIPILKKMGKRNRIKYSENIIESAKREANRIEALINKGKDKISNREIIKETVYLNLLAERVLSIYSEQQIEGYLNIYNNILSAKNKINAIDKSNKNDENLSAANEIIQNVVQELHYIDEREKKIYEFNR